MEERPWYLKRSCGLASDEVDLDLSCLVLSCCRSDQIRSDLSFQGSQAGSVRACEWEGEWEGVWPAGDGPLVCERF